MLEMSDLLKTASETIKTACLNEKMHLMHLMLSFNNARERQREKGKTERER